MQEHSKFFNKHYNLVARLEERVTKNGNSNMAMSVEEMNMGHVDNDDVEAFNVMQLFSLAKKSPNPNSLQKLPQMQAENN